jgi:TonB family protein
MPAPALESLPLPEPPTDTELLVLNLPLPSPWQALTEAPAFDKDSSSPATPVAYDATKIVPFAQEQVAGAIEKMSAGVTTQLPLPPLELPTAGHLAAGTETVPMLPASIAAVTTAIIEQALQSPGIPGGEEKQVEWGAVRLGDKQIPSRLGLPTIDQRLIARSLPAIPSPRPALPPPQFGIQGPVARREPLYRPALPQVQVQAASDITLKFWVRPDGVVSRVLPERKGDAVLEVAAIRYLEGWRFTPLLPHESQVEQWGTITIRFLLRER